MTMTGPGPVPLIRETPKLADQRVTVMGLGLFGGGLGVARFLVNAGARVVITDQKSEHDLREAVAELKGLPIELRLGGHREEDFRDADLVVVNPAVPRSSPWLAMARALETEMNLFWKLCPTTSIAGITGSNGKTTTTTLVGEILKRGPRPAWVGGNIGVSLLERLPEIRPEDLVVLELSSFQLENLGVLKRSPRVAAVLNLTPNHLDRHGTFEAYAEAKRQIVAHQSTSDAKILHPGLRGFESPSTTYLFSADTLAKEAIGVSRRKIPGDFNLENMAAAALIAREATGGRWAGWKDACETVFNSFPGVEHRLEFVAEKRGVKYYNDSKATDPEATVAALSTLPGPFVLILGGFDKKTPYDLLAREVAARPVRACVLMGQTAPAIEAALRAQGRVPDLLRASSMTEAVAAAAARPGETVLLSPACASWDMYRNFTERGNAFKALVKALPEG
jgi:UDP-N-acetylmuramoylalanine--D-glutamate ligase